jgi:hypothetical protein
MAPGVRPRRATDAREGFAVAGPVPTVAQAIELIDEGVSDAAILDTQLDGETTFAIAECLDKHGIPLMFVSGNPPRDFAPLLDHSTVLGKPADWPVVLSTLRKLTA